MKTITALRIALAAALLLAVCSTAEAGHYRARFNAFGVGYGVAYAPVQVVQTVPVAPVQTFAAPGYGSACQTNALGVTTCNTPVQTFAAPGYAAGVGYNAFGAGVGYNAFGVGVGYRTRFNNFGAFHGFNNFNRLGGVGVGRGVNLAIGRDVFGRRVFRLGVR